MSIATGVVNAGFGNGIITIGNGNGGGGAHAVGIAIGNALGNGDIARGNAMALGYDGIIAGSIITSGSIAIGNPNPCIRKHCKLGSHHSGLCSYIIPAVITAILCMRKLKLFPKDVTFIIGRKYLQKLKARRRCNMCRMNYLPDHNVYKHPNCKSCRNGRVLCF